MPSKAQQVLIDYADLNWQTTGGDEIACACPFCGETRKKLYISPNGKFICFVCGTKGNSVTSFVMQLEKIPYREAKDLLKDQDYREAPQVVQTTDNSLFSALSLMQGKQEPVYNYQEEKHCPPYPTNTKFIKDLNYSQLIRDAIPYIKYLDHRGITAHDVIDYNIGFTDYGEIKRPNKSPLVLKQSIVFTTYNRQHEPIYWNTRSIEADPYIKSFNALSQENEYSKKDTVFNLNRVDKDRIAVVCEGVFNAITCTQDQYVGLATFGKAVTKEQLELIVKAQPKAIYLFLDNDALKQSLDLPKRIKSIDSTIPIRYVLNPYGKMDANDLGKQKTKELLDKVSPTSLYTYLKMINNGGEM